MSNIFDIILKAIRLILLFHYYLILLKGKYKILDVKAFNYDNVF
jgi:hypothetical protein